MKSILASFAFYCASMACFWEDIIYMICDLATTVAAITGYEHAFDLAECLLIIAAMVILEKVSDVVACGEE